MEGSQLTVILGAICLSVVSAGLSTAASIYTEYLFKTDRRPFFEQQIQLYLFGVLITGVWATYITKGNPFVVEGNLSVTLLWLLILTIFLGGAGGLLVAAIIKNIDNIAKIYASTIAILVTGVVCWILFPENFQMTVTFVLAICMILASSVLYERAKPKEPDETSNKNGSKPTVLSKENVSLNSAPEHKI
uniref:CMP-sialic acid transporter 1-like n=1 Tax=Saccoglossus kowalevskii TaxID=10224 RepID=A0ABM0M3A8_SACKO|nr:PREDICTED: CMP-sialic acid transporter 1-like [Saccoglossus kowalevskii]